MLITDPLRPGCHVRYWLLLGQVATLITIFITMLVTTFMRPSPHVHYQVAMLITSPIPSPIRLGCHVHH